VDKGVRDESAGVVFRGKILGRKDAQKTDGRQTNKTLLLAPGTEMDYKPELEIYADDVKCAHGATTGDLSEEAMFYLKARGIDARQAQAMLVAAFVGEAVTGIQAAGPPDRGPGGASVASSWADMGSPIERTALPRATPVHAKARQANVFRWITHPAPVGCRDTNCQPDATLAGPVNHARLRTFPGRTTVTFTRNGRPACGRGRKLECIRLKHPGHDFGEIPDGNSQQHLSRYAHPRPCVDCNLHLGSVPRRYSRRCCKHLA